MPFVAYLGRVLDTDAREECELVCEYVPRGTYRGITYIFVFYVFSFFVFAFFFFNFVRVLLLFGR